MCVENKLPSLEQTAIRIQQILLKFQAKYTPDSPTLIRLERTLADFYVGLEKRAALSSGS